MRLRSKFHATTEKVTKYSPYSVPTTEQESPHPSIQSPPSEDDQQSSISTSLDTLLEDTYQVPERLSDTYQVPERLNFSELPDLGNNPLFWPEIQPHHEAPWRAGSTTTTADYSSGTSDQNSPASSLIVMSPPQSAPTGAAAGAPLPHVAAAAAHPAPPPPPTYLLPPCPPPPYVQPSLSSPATVVTSTFSTPGEHTRSNSVPADMYFLSNDNSPF